MKTTRWFLYVQKKKSCHISFLIKRFLLYCGACVTVIGDFNTHSHVSLNDCQLNMNNFFFTLYSKDDNEGKKFSRSIFFLFFSLIWILLMWLDYFMFDILNDWFIYKRVKVNRNWQIRKKYVDRLSTGFELTFYLSIQL